jgi:hypothetical protein
MISLLQNSRCFFYKKVKLDDKIVRWELIRQITDYPSELERGHEDRKAYNLTSLHSFSDCFERYLVTDKQTQ